MDEALVLNDATKEPTKEH